MRKKENPGRKYRISKRFVLIVLGIALPSVIALYYWVQNSETVDSVYLDDDYAEEEMELLPSIIRFGFDTTEYRITDAELKSGQTLGSILLNEGFSNLDVHNIVQAAEGIFYARYVRPGEQYHFVYYPDDTVQIPRHLIYEKSLLVYYRFDLQDSISVQRFEKETSIRVDTVTAVVTSSLYEALRAEDVPVQVIMGLADVYGWVIDFFRIQKGDYVKMVYEVKVVDDSVAVGYGRIPAATFFHAGRAWNSFYYRSEDGQYEGYFDEKGDAMRKAFLKAPLDFFRISSRYNPRRFHPVLKSMRPHLGTDYAAPAGSPIRTTADGVIEKAGYTSGNGNYIKVRHNSTYSTQYLHMSKFAPGMKQGKSVKQGDVIGYVGSTGLATGPHVCYRFWKNGVQVDPLKEELPAAEPIDEKQRENFEQQMRVKMEMLRSLPLNEAS